MKSLGLDWGKSRIGIAASDEDGVLAFARKSLTRRGLRRDLDELVRIAREEAAGQIVLGLPLREDGSDGEAAREVRSAATSIREALGLEVVLWDERYSTREAAERLRELGFDAKRARALIDAEAARGILQGYLDHVRDGRA